MQCYAAHNVVLCDRKGKPELDYRYLLLHEAGSPFDVHCNRLEFSSAQVISLQFVFSFAVAMKLFICTIWGGVLNWRLPKLDMAVLPHLNRMEGLLRESLWYKVCVQANFWFEATRTVATLYMLWREALKVSDICGHRTCLYHLDGISKGQNHSSLLKLVFVHQYQLMKDLAPPAMGAPTAKVIIIDTDIEYQYTNKTSEFCRLLCRLNAILNIY